MRVSYLRAADVRVLARVEIGVLLRARLLRVGLQRFHEATFKILHPDRTVQTYGARSPSEAI